MRIGSGARVYTLGYSWMLLAGLAGGCSAFMGVVSASAAEREFRGQLNYVAFEKAAKRKETVRVKYSPGGTGAAALALARVPKVIIDGACNSACAWSFVRNPGACFTSRSSFGFHAAHDPGTGRRLDAATRYWLSSVRGNLRGRLDGLLVSSRLIRLSARDMRRYYGDRVCEPAANPVIMAEAKSLKPATVDGPRTRKRAAKSRVAVATAPIVRATADVAAWSGQDHSYVGHVLPTYSSVSGDLNLAVLLQDVPQSELGPELGGDPSNWLKMMSSSLAVARYSGNAAVLSKEGEGTSLAGTLVGTAQFRLLDPGLLSVQSVSPESGPALYGARFTAAPASICWGDEACIGQVSQQRAVDTDTMDDIAMAPARPRIWYRHEDVARMAWLDLMPCFTSLAALIMRPERPEPVAMTMASAM